jgi:hypothetical protein
MPRSREHYYTFYHFFFALLEPQNDVLDGTSQYYG